MRDRVGTLGIQGGKMSCFVGEDDETKAQSRKNKAINDQLKKDKDIYKSTHRLLLLG